MEYMQHCPIAEHKGQSFAFVALRRINPKFLRLFQNNLLNPGSNSTVTVQNTGSRCNAYVRGRCDFAEAYFAFMRRLILHV